jgi:hypothetical protein
MNTDNFNTPKTKKTILYITVICSLLMLLVMKTGYLISKDNQTNLIAADEQKKPAGRTGKALDISELIASRTGYNDATISWKTDQSSIGRIEYGKTDAYGSISDYTPDASVAHDLTIKGLSDNTKYHYRVICETGNGSVISADNVFETPAIPAEEPLTYGICIGYMDIIFKIEGNKVVIAPEAEKVLTQVKKDGFIYLRMMEPFARGYMKHFPDMSVQAIKLLTDRGFEVLLCINGSPFINGSSDPAEKWVYRIFPGNDKEGTDDDGGLAEHKRRLTKFMDAVKDAGLIPHMQFQLFDEPNSKRYFHGTYEEWEQLLAANAEIIGSPKYGIAKKDILCCAFTSKLALAKFDDEEKKDQNQPFLNFIKNYKNNPLVNQFTFSFHWYPSEGISPKSSNSKARDIKIPVYPGAYITEMNVTAYMTKDQLMGKGNMPGYRARNEFKEKVTDVIAYAKANQISRIYFFNLKTKTDVPDQKGRISTGLFNAAGCPRKEYKDLLEILNKPADFGPCGEPKESDL